MQGAIFYCLLHQSLFVHPTRQVDERSVGDTGHNKDHVTGKSDADQRRDLVHAPECPEGIEDRVEQLGNHRRSVVSQPQCPPGIPVKAFLRQRPPLVIRPYVEPLADRVYQHAHQHQPRCIGEDLTDRRLRPVACRRMIQQPGLGNDDEKHRGEYPDVDRFLAAFFLLISLMISNTVKVDAETGYFLSCLLSWPKAFTMISTRCWR